MWRLTVLVVCGFIVGGCAASRSQAAASPDALVIAFADGFHSGLILERSQVPARFVHDRGDPALRPWVVIHFGERRWILGEADSVWDAVRLGLVGGGGGIRVDAVEWWCHGCGGTDQSEERLWTFAVTRPELAGLLARLDAWLAPGAVSEALGPQACWWPSCRSWTVAGNCHDFTADLLAGSGVVVGRDPIQFAPALRSALDRAWAGRDGR